jgi:hypothetical protein
MYVAYATGKQLSVVAKTFLEFLQKESKACPVFRVLRAIRASQ